MRRINRMLPNYLKGVSIILFAMCFSFFVGFMTPDVEPIEPAHLPGRYLAAASDSPSAVATTTTERECKGDTILPLVPGETEWNKTARATIYLIFLIWLFLGTAIAADVFMTAIEVITSKTKPIMINGQQVDVDVWNATVANLTLMALGSSAPEIMLAVIETISLTFESGDLGAGTIVGSAAFNLFFITAICIIAPPPEEVAEGEPPRLENRRIEEFGVFMITATSSVWAYLSLVVFLKLISEDVVEIWEALLTLFSFPLLVFLSWGQDNGWWRNKDNAVAPAEHAEHITNVIDGHGHKVRRPSQSVALEDQEGGDQEGEEKEAPAKERRASQTSEAIEIKKKKKSRLEYRIQATRKMTGGKRVIAPVKKDDSLEDPEKGRATIGFEETKWSFLEGCGTAEIKVKRTGELDKAVSVMFDTSDCDAKAGSEYVQTSGQINFAPNQTSHNIEIEIIDDDEWAPDKNFFVRLYDATYTGTDPKESKPDLLLPTAEVMILNDDDPGKISFESKVVAFGTTETQAQLKLLRTDGCSGTVLAFLKTTDGSAIGGTDFDPLTEDLEVEFKHEQRDATVAVNLLGSGNGNITFTVELTSVMPEGCAVGENATCTVVISDDKKYTAMVGSVLAIMEEEEYKLETTSWIEQLENAMNMEVDEDCEPECMDYFMHAISFYWKVLHALCPPTHLWGGWGTFVASICSIGFITCLVGDTAKTFGCLIGLEDTITAITFVALGTSLPDTFASMEATVADETADAACGNVTGSNSVNVFLGLGLPWTLATIYHASKGTKYVYPAGNLVFSVIAFSIGAIITLLLLFYRRKTQGGELGGPQGPARVHAVIMAALWFIYVIMSALKTKGHFD